MARKETFRSQLEADQAETRPDGKVQIDPNRMNTENGEERPYDEQILRDYEAHQRSQEGGPDADPASEFQGY